MKKKEFSCEFFPPKTEEGLIKLLKVAEKLEIIQPSVFSVTFGAGGSTQANTLKTIRSLQTLNYAPIAPHLTCIGSTKAAVSALIQQYKSEGFRHIVALRGDLPDGMIDPGEFKHANELIAYIREQSQDHFHLYAAAYPEFHPEAPNPQSDINALLSKFKSGANEAITQYFFNGDSYLYLRDEIRKQGYEHTLIPGIMPITNYTQLARFSNMCGAEIPRWLRMKLERFGDDSEGLKAFGTDFMVAMCERLAKEGVDHFHFYTLNQSEPTLKIIRCLQ